MKPSELAPLPYAYDYLEPVIDTATMKLHHDKTRYLQIARPFERGYRR